MKEMLSKDAVDKLNLLVEKNFDAAKEYKMAAGNANDPALRGFLNDYALQREQFALDLNTELHNLGEQPLINDSRSGQIQQGWFNMSSALSMGRDRAVLKECVNGERTALSQYWKILKNTRFCPATEQLLRNQQSVVENAYRRIKNLEGLFNEKRS